MEQPVDLDRWPRAAQFRWFRAYERPHFATTARLDITHLMARKAEGVSAYRACLWAIGAGLHAVPELAMRFRGEGVVRHDRLSLSMTVPTEGGGFNFAYVPHHDDFATYDAEAARLIAQAARQGALDGNAGERDDLAYASCLPWIDFTAITSAMPHAEDCIPRVSFGKFVDHGGRWDMAMALEVHHALVDGRQVGEVFAAVQAALDRV